MAKVYIVWYINPEIHKGEGVHGLWYVCGNEEFARSTVEHVTIDYGFQAWYTCEEVF